MANFAELNSENVVTRVLMVDNIKNMTRKGVETESIGIDLLEKVTGHRNWKQCSYNTHLGEHRDGKSPFRGNFPGIGWIYNEEHDIFHEEQPYASWTLNTTTGKWTSPSGDMPELSDEDYATQKYYTWDEDNTQWVLND